MFTSYDWVAAPLESVLRNRLDSYPPPRSSGYLLARDALYARPVRPYEAAPGMLGAHWNDNMLLAERAAVGHE